MTQTAEKARITTHVLNLNSGKPAAGMSVSLFSPSSNKALTSGMTDADGRVIAWQDDFELVNGVWHLEFATTPWFIAQGQECFFDQVRLSFKVNASEPHYHVPLLLNAFGYSTYRGS